MTDTSIDSSTADAAASPSPDVAVPAAKAPKHRKRGRITMWLAIAWLVALTFTAVFASYLPFVYHSCSQFDNAKLCHTYKKPNPLLAERPPSWATFSDTVRPIVGGAPARTGWFGTDTNGFDVFSRSIYGARNSLLIGAMAIIFGILGGGALGLIAGYLGKRTDKVIDTATNVLLSFPALLLAIFIVGFFGNRDTSAAGSQSITPIVIALTILSIPPIARLVRANTMVYAQREFVTAARSIGAKNRRIITREILPNVLPAMLTFAITGMAILIVTEGALAYLGLSVSAPTPTWGKLIVDGQSKLETAWWISIMPAGMLFVTVLSINLLGDVVSERFRVREAIA